MMTNELLDLTALIVSEYAANNSMPASELPALIQSVHGALSKVGQPVEVAAPAALVGATTARKSLSDPAKIISMIDGKPYAMLGRHIRGNGYTPPAIATPSASPAIIR